MGNGRVLVLVLVAMLLPSLGQLPDPASEGSASPGVVDAEWVAAQRAGRPRQEHPGRKASPSPLTQMGLRRHAHSDAVLANEVLLEPLTAPAARREHRRPAAMEAPALGGEPPALFRTSQAALGGKNENQLQLSLPSGAMTAASSERAKKRRPWQCRYRGAEGTVECEREAYYGSGKDRKSALWCRKHRQPGDVDLRNQRCKREGCNRVAIYSSSAPLSPKVALPLDRRKGRRRGAAVGATLCARHRRKADKDVRSKRCQHPDGCLLPAKYGLISQGRVRFCKQHRIKGKHVYLASKRCEHEGCLR